MFYATRLNHAPRSNNAMPKLTVSLAATVAFGHSGFLVMEGGMGNALRSYYMLQQLQQSLLA